MLPPGEAEVAGPSEIRVSAPAKLNLYLHIVGRRADSYHLLDSLAAFVDVGDEIIARPAETLTIALDGPYAAALTADADNLVLRAARGLAELTGARAGAALTLMKNLPVAAGLGGGSSDAAATLDALSALWNVAPDEAAFARLAVSLGADVPVCRHGAPARMTGIGDAVEPAPDLPPCGVVLVNPNLPLSTDAVYAARGGPFSDPYPIAGRFDTVEALAAALKSRRNDLFGAAIGLMPEIGEVIDALEADPACLLARLSGSGPSCFGLYGDEKTAARAAARIAADRPGWWVRAARFTVGAQRP